jgi:hypothetical protein
MAACNDNGLRSFLAILASRAFDARSIRIDKTVNFESFFVVFMVGVSWLVFHGFL